MATKRQGQGQQVSWTYIAQPNWWTYPETGVIILGEDMPVELQPE